MAAVPFSLVGIFPAHCARNSIILVDCIHLRLRQGMPHRVHRMDSSVGQPWERNKNSRTRLRG